MYQERNENRQPSSTPPSAPTSSHHAKDLAAIEQAVADRRWKEADDAAWRILTENEVANFPTLKNTLPTDLRNLIPVERRPAVAVALSQIGRGYINSNRDHGDSYELHAALCFQHGITLEPGSLAIAVDFTSVASQLSASTIRSYSERGVVGFPSSPEGIHATRQTAKHAALYLLEHFLHIGDQQIEHGALFPEISSGRTRAQTCTCLTNLAAIELAEIDVLDGKPSVKEARNTHRERAKALSLTALRSVGVRARKSSEALLEVNEIVRAGSFAFGDQSKQARSALTTLGKAYETERNLPRALACYDLAGKIRNDAGPERELFSQLIGSVDDFTLASYLEGLQKKKHETAPPESWDALRTTVADDELRDNVLALVYHSELTQQGEGDEELLVLTELARDITAFRQGGERATEFFLEASEREVHSWWETGSTFPGLVSMVGRMFLLSRLAKVDKGGELGARANNVHREMEEILSVNTMALDISDERLSDLQSKMTRLAGDIFLKR